MSETFSHYFCRRIKCSRLGGVMHMRNPCSYLYIKTYHCTRDPSNFRASPRFEIYLRSKFQTNVRFRSAAAIAWLIILPVIDRHPNTWESPRLNLSSSKYLMCVAELSRALCDARRSTIKFMCHILGCKEDSSAKLLKFDWTRETQRSHPAEPIDDGYCWNIDCAGLVHTNYQLL